ncbi:MAG: ATP-dependent DNA ligase [Promethearchaeota archaeon]
MRIKNDQIETKLNTYIRGKPESLPIPELAHLIDNYKKNIAQRLIPRKYEKIPKIRGDVLYASVKIDGEYVAYYYDGTDNSFFCNSPTHRVYMGLPVNEDLDKIMKSKGIKSALIGGELFASSHDPLNFEVRTRILDFIHYSRNPGNQEDLERIGFKAFDILQINGKEWMTKLFKNRFDKLCEIFPRKGRASMVKSMVVKNSRAIEQFYKENVIDHDMEGVVVRTEDVGFKIKPVHTIDVAIIGICEGLYGSKLNKDQLATTLVALRNPNGDYQILSSVGGGLTDEARTDLLKKFEIIPTKGFSIPNRYDGRVFHMVKPGIVGQIDYLDLLVERRGAPIYQNSLRFNEKEQKWETLQPVQFATLISPRFVKDHPLRTDKDANNIIDVRVSQITDLVDVPKTDAISQLQLEKSTILARKVFEKDNKMVRKFIVWETNKGGSGLYPDFVIYFLDYSENRKEHYKRKTKITNDKEQAFEIFDSWVNAEMLSTNKSSFKKGWSEFSIKDIRENKIYD